MRNQKMDNKGRWEFINGCCILRPPNGINTKCIMHFIGGAFIGAAPELAYRKFLEALSLRGILVTNIKLL